MTNPKPQFTHARLKVQRAYRHVQEIEARLQKFLETDFCKLHIEIEPNTGRNILKLESIALPPAHIVLAFGDAVHNLRCALDYVSTHFVGKDENRISFPVGKKRDDLVASNSFRSIQKAFPDFAMYVADVIQPYEGGNFKVWEIGTLDNFDKHKLLVPVVTVTGMTGALLEDNCRNTYTMDLRVGPGGVLDALSTDTTLKINSYGKPAGLIRFPKGLPFQNEPVIPTMLQLVQSTHQAVESLEAFCFGNVVDPNSVKP